MIHLTNDGKVCILFLLGCALVALRIADALLRSKEK